MKGRKPKLRLVTGTGSGGSAPPVPAGLDAHGAAEWRRVAPILMDRGHLTDDTLSSLEAYCRAVGLSRTYTAMMDAEGHVLQTDKGPVTHPAFKMLMGAMREARLLAAELALTPHRRGTADKGEGGKADGWDSDLLA